MHATTTQEALARDVPATSDASVFGADIVLLGAFVISVGIPLYHTYGLTAHPVLVAWYIASAMLLPALMPLAVWALRWGRPQRAVVRPMVRASLLYALPVLPVAAAIAHAGLEGGLTGLSVMAYLAAVLIAVVHGRLTRADGKPRMLVVRWALVVLTPVVVLGLTDVLPHGLDAILGWSIPMPVVAASAVGCARALERYQRERVGDGLS